jgi:Mce-associated membrane protein
MSAKATNQSVPHAPESAVTASRRRPTPLVIVLGVLVVLSAVGVGLLGWQAWTDHQAQRDRAEALDAARVGAGQVLTFDPANVNAQLAAARKIVSGTFAAQFDQLATAAIVPATQQDGLATKADVTRAAVVDSQPDQVDVLLFVRQTSSSKSQPQAQSVTNQVKLTMTRAEGRWLISTMQPL